MAFVKDYIEYLKDNPQDYWFKRKLFGWGWVPVKWQGWTVLAVFILFIAWSAMSLASDTPEPSRDQLMWYFTKIILSVALIILICYKKGEKPKWQWGLPKKDKV